MKTEEGISKELSQELKLFLEKEAEFAKLHKKDSDEELLEYLKSCTKKLGRRPNKADVVGYTYIKSRLGPWNRILERAGLKEKSAKQIIKEQRKENVCNSEEKKKSKLKNKREN